MKLYCTTILEVHNTSYASLRSYFQTDFQQNHVLSPSLLPVMMTFTLYFQKILEVLSGLKTSSHLTQQLAIDREGKDVPTLQCLVRVQISKTQKKGTSKHKSQNLLAKCNVNSELQLFPQSTSQNIARVKNFCSQYCKSLEDGS